jgi:septal ring factor EnvC (AmiA/AmiB activator)
MKWPFLIMNLFVYIFTCLILLYLPNGIRMTNMRRVNTTQADTTQTDTTQTDTTQSDTTQVETTRLEARQELDTLKQLISELKSARHELEKSKQEDAMYVDV